MSSNPDFRKMQSNPDGKAGHDERTSMNKRQRKVDVKRIKRKYNGNRWLKKRIHEYVPRRFADPTKGLPTPSKKTVPLPTDCSLYKVGCTFVNCDTCIKKHKKDKHEQKLIEITTTKFRAQIVSSPPTLWEKLVWERYKKIVEGNRGSYDIIGIAELDAKIELLEKGL